MKIPEGFISIGDNLITRDPRIAMDTRDQDEEDEQAEDAELARHIGKAVYDAIRAHRKRAKDGRRAGDEEDAEEVGETSERSVSDGRRRGRDAMPDPKDHRRDFRSGDTRERDEVFARARDSRTRGASDGIATDSAREACNLDALFPSDGNGRPYRRDREE